MNMQNNKSDITLIKDSEWSVIDGEICRVITFTPWGLIKNGKVLAIDKTTPYASIIFECKKFSKKATGYITHKMDFEHLWAAFKERTVKQDEEVIILWSKKHYKRYVKLFSAFMPKLWVMICPRGSFELKTDSIWKPELIGETRWNAAKPIVEWKPEVME